jgi:hypothetical protein
MDRVTLAFLLFAASCSPLFAQGFGRPQDGFYSGQYSGQYNGLYNAKSNPRVDGRGSHNQGSRRAPRTRTIDCSIILSG